MQVSSVCAPQLSPEHSPLYFQADPVMPELAAAAAAAAVVVVVVVAGLKSSFLEFHVSLATLNITITQ